MDLKITMIMMSIFKMIMMFVLLALSVGFYTLMERKILSYIQIRKGPNKVGMMGIPQPLADAAKLFTKESLFINLSNKPMFILSPLMAMIIMFMTWNLYTSMYGINTFKLGLLFFLVVSSFNVFAILVSGWSSNSKYSLLGALRAVAQTISYEVSMALIIMSILMLSMSFNLFEMKKSQTMWFFLIGFPLMIMWFISCLAETNRAPFDLAEGESELVSGFNIEYGSGEFAFLFIAEYGSILFMSMLTSCLFAASMSTNMGIINSTKTLLVALAFLWVRGSYPRMRYDKLMSLTWKSFLTISITSIMIIMTQW